MLKSVYNWLTLGQLPQGVSNHRTSGFGGSTGRGRTTGAFFNRGSTFSLKRFWLMGLFNRPAIQYCWSNYSVPLEQLPSTVGTTTTQYRWSNYAVPLEQQLPSTVGTTTTQHRWSNYSVPLEQLPSTVGITISQYRWNNYVVPLEPYLCFCNSVHYITLAMELSTGLLKRTVF